MPLTSASGHPSRSGPALLPGKIARSPIPGEEEQVVAPAVSTRALGPSLVHVFDRVEVERLTSVPSDQPRRDVHEEEIRVVGIRRAMVRRRYALEKENLDRAIELAGVEVLVEPGGHVVHVHFWGGAVTAPGGVRGESGHADVLEVDGAVGTEKAGEASAETFDALAATGAIVVAQRRDVAAGLGDFEAFELAELARVAAHAPGAVAPAELLIARAPILAPGRAPRRLRVGTTRAAAHAGAEVEVVRGVRRRGWVERAPVLADARGAIGVVARRHGRRRGRVFGAKKGRGGRIILEHVVDERRATKHAPAGASPSRRENRHREQQSTRDAHRHGARRPLSRADSVLYKRSLDRVENRNRLLARR